ncbi:MAG: patatin-like phospholipase family protein [Gammaproteobacteria bacterium]|nr:patatin-like phospholipase family protein [Gammaproteobacteria bacterium]TVQ46314.1 MAG: serine protease [Gammaproteobacteria bacterium]
MPTVSLVLGSGGARGLAHIGVIRWLEENGYRIRSIAGSSMGALVGGIHAAGKLEVYADWVSALERVDVLRLLDLSLSRHSLFKGERIIAKLRELVGEHDIESLPMRFTAVATDIERQREVWLDRGSLFDAIRASVAVPMVFAPVRRNGRLLVDGGLVNPMPVAPVLNSDADLIIAVNLGAHASRQVGTRIEADSRTPSRASSLLEQPSRASEMTERIRSFVMTLWQDEGDETPEEAPDLVMLMSRSLDCMQTQITRLRLATHSIDAVVEIPRNLCGFFEFYRARELIAYGYDEAGRQLADLAGSSRPAQLPGR